MLLFIAVFGLYAPTLRNGFALDDPLVASATLPSGEPNRMTGALRPLGEYFRANYWYGNDGQRSDLYRPLTILGFALTNAITHAAWPHHAINVLWKLLAVGIAWWLLSRVVTPWPALIGAAWFGSHALHSEAVAGVVGRAELASFCAGGVATVLLLRAGFWSWFGATVALFAALCSKESAVAWVVFAPLCGCGNDLARGVACRWRRHGARALLAAVPAVGVFAALRAAAIDPDVPVLYLANPLWSAAEGTRFATGLMLWGFGIWKCVWPFAPTADYGPVTFDLAHSWSDPRVLAAAAVLLAWPSIGLAWLRRHPAVGLGAACYLGFSVWTSNVPFAIGILFAERLLFTPSLGVALVVAWALSRPRLRWIVGSLLVPWCIASAWVVLARNGAWADDRALALAEAEANPRCVRFLDKRARLHRDDGEPRFAESLWRRCLALDPDFPDARIEFALFLITQRRVREAERELLRALEVPEVRRPQRHMTRLDLSVLYERMGRNAESVAQVRQAWAEASAFDPVSEDLLVRAWRLLPPAELDAILARGERERPEHHAWPLIRAERARKRGERSNAEALYRRALRVAPRHAPARLGLGLLLRGGDEPQRGEGRRILEQLRDDPRASPFVRSQARRALGE